jgi:hypothetical protein
MDLVIGIPVQIMLGNTLPIMACDFDNGGDGNEFTEYQHTLHFSEKCHCAWSLGISMDDCLLR